MRPAIVAICLSFCLGSVLHGQEISKEWADVAALQTIVERNYKEIASERERVDATVDRAENAYTACSVLLASDQPKALVSQSQISWRALQRDRKWIDDRRIALEKRRHDFDIERKNVEHRKRSRRVQWYEQQMMNLIVRIRQEYIDPLETQVMAPTISYLNGANEYARFIQTAAEECRRIALARQTPKIAAQPAERVLTIMYRNFVERVTTLQNLLIPMKKQ